MTNAASASDSTGPRVARSGAERLTNTELKRINSITWAAAELHRATRELIRALQMDEAEQERYLQQLFGTADRSDFLLAGQPFQMLYMYQWFGDRYRAHAPLVGTYHFLRFNAAHQFLSVHDEALRRDGWFTTEERGTLWDDALVLALATIEFRTDRVSVDIVFPRLDYNHVTSLAEAIRDGNTRPTEFKRSPWKGPGSEVYEVDYEGQNDTMPIALLAEALGYVSQLFNMEPAERAAYEDRVHKAMPEVLPKGATYEQVALLMWLMETHDVDSSQVTGYGNRIFAAHAFLNEHQEQLIRDGLVIETEDALGLSAPLLNALNVAALEIPRGSDGHLRFDYDSIRKGAELFRTIERLQAEADPGEGNGRP